MVSREYLLPRSVKLYIGEFVYEESEILEREQVLLVQNCAICALPYSEEEIGE